MPIISEKNQRKILGHVLAKNLFLERKALPKEILYFIYDGKGDVNEKETVESER